MCKDKGSELAHYELVIERLERIEFEISNNGYTNRELDVMQDYVLSLNSKLQARIDTND